MIYVVLITLYAMELLIILLVLGVTTVIVANIITIIEVYHHNWKTKKCQRKAQKDWEEYLQRKQKRLLRKKDKENYPLFFLKEGIV